MPYGTGRRPALTLIELLVVISIVGILMALLFPAVSRVREVSRRSGCMNNLRQFGLAQTNYESSYGRFPPSNTTLHLSSFAALLPYMEQQPLYSQINMSIKIYHGSWDFEFHTIGSTRLTAFICPTDSGGMDYLKFNYSACAGWNKDSDATCGI